MKKFILLFFLTSSFTLFSQTLPIDFESDVTSDDFVDFDGGTATVVSNPYSTGANTSTNVAKLVRDGGQVWAGSKLELDNNIDFSALGAISMSFYTNAPVGTTIKLKLEGADGANFEVDQLTTVSDEWETMTFDFTGQTEIFNFLVFIFDINNLGDGSETSTFYFDDIQQVEGAEDPELTDIDLPLDFETGITTEHFNNFDGGTATVVSNPSSSVLNNSATVGQVVRDGGQIWAGSSLNLANNLDFSSLGAISMSIYTNAPAGVVIKLKLEGDDGSNVEVDQITNFSGEWKTMTFDFTGQPATFNDLVFIFDFGNLGDGSDASTFYFDDIQQVQVSTDPELEDIVLPLNFESDVTDNFVDFDGGTASVVVNPLSSGINTSANVAKIVREGGQIWAGSKIQLLNNLDFSTLGAISMSFYSTAPIGTAVKFKLEGDGGANFEVDQLTTVSGEWESMTFDFTGQPTVFDYLVFLFDFGNLGDGSAASTFYFDDIQQVVASIDPDLEDIDLPIDFESDVTSENFVDFDGGAGSVAANPLSAGINTSTKVGKIVRDGGQVWAGSSLMLADNLDFSALGAIAMSVYTTAPIGSLIKLKLEGADDAAFEVDRYTTSTGEWETMTFDFTGQPAIFNDLVFIFDFGTLGDGSATSTFYFDDIQQVEGFIDPELEDIDLPIDFESEVTTEHFVDFDGGFASVVSNPQPSGLNESPTVAKIVRDGGALWAGSKLKLVDNINFSTLGAISMSFYTTAPIGTNVKLKLEGDDGANFEVDKLTTVSGEWENMSFDFSGQPEVFDFLVFMFDFGNLGDSSETSTFYFDGIYQTDPSGGGPTLNQIDFPVDFEDETVDYTVTDFGGNASTLVVDPEDESNHVIKTIKTLGAEIWAGTTIGTETGFATYLPFTLEESKMSVRVWSPDAGISIRLKVEDSNDNTHTCETEAVTTVANAWDTLVFDFTNEAAGTQSLEVGLGMGWTYNEAAVFFNFGVEGAVDKTYYFDDVIFGVNTGDVGITNQSINEVLAYPNPTLDKWVFDANNQNIQAIKIYDVLGKRIFQDDPNTSIFEVDASNWESGIYMSTIMIGTTITNQLLIKK